MILLDPDGRIRDWNRAAGTIFGHALDDVLGMSAEILLTPEDRAAACWRTSWRWRSTQGAARDDRWLMRQDGTRLRAEGVVTPLFSAAGVTTGFSKIIRDTTPAYEAQQALRQGKEEAERANELKDQFLAVLSHELRSPLSAITGWADILTNFSDAHPLLGKASTVIRRNAQLQARMINDLLDMSAVVAGKLMLQTTPMDLAALAADSVLGRAARGAGQGRGAELPCGGAGVDPGRCAAPVAGDHEPDRQRHQVHRERRQRRRAGRGRGRLRARCACGTRAAASRRSSCPSSSIGCGREDGSKTRKVGGLGLGTGDRARDRAAAPGPHQRRQSGPGRGAVFELRLPMLAEQALAPSPCAEPVELSEDTLSGVRVLLVDDEEDAREVGQVALSRLGAKVSVATSAAEVLSRLEEGEEHYDLLVSDIGMPEMDGRSLIRAVRQLPGGSLDKLPAVALTAFAMVADRQEGLAAGFQGYVAKPIELAALTRAVQEALGRKAGGD